MKKIYLPVIMLLVITNGAAIVFSKTLKAKGVDMDLVLGGNLLIAASTLLGIYISGRGLQNKNPQAMVRAMMGSITAKFFILAIAAFAYIMSVKTVDKTALFVCLGLYLVYNFLGTYAMMQQKKQFKDEQGKGTL